ncbi:hypothetical protein F442_18030 [Phytophthora nicotianae P10297]|uniref:RxLR effector protein n=1 Tax=Phytophthora nicotianae P10297 TaxID=1317064 RepID=W2YEP6_PHYNI|nr:hypothetical protein F442_18030 [Phytophthora nicotianae P10297]
MNVVQMFAVVVALVATSSAAIKKTDNNEKHYLRSLKVANKPVADEEEERVINFSFLKNIQKKLPGTAAYKAAKAAQAAKEEAEIVGVLKMSDSRKDLLHSLFRQ